MGYQPLEKIMSFDVREIFFLGVKSSGCNEYMMGIPMIRVCMPYMDPSWVYIFAMKLWVYPMIYIFYFSMKKGVETTSMDPKI